MQKKQNQKRVINIRSCKYCGRKFFAPGNQQYCTRKCAGAWRTMFGKHYIPVKKDTLCWECKKSTAGADCPWANEFKPVEGWKATQTQISVYRGNYTISFVVHECPIFERG